MYENFVLRVTHFLICKNIPIVLLNIISKVLELILEFMIYWESSKFSRLWICQFRDRSTRNEIIRRDCW